MDWHFALGFCGILLLTLMVSIDATSLSVALPSMAEDIDGTAIEAFWAGTSFLLASCVFQPSFGSFSTIFGRKPLLYFAIILFTVGTVLAAIANNFTLILVGRTIQGIGGGGVLVLSEILITDLVPLVERAKFLSLQSMMWCIGTIVGPVMGGGFAEKVSWRWIFWVNLPFVAVSAPLLVFFLRLNFPISSTMAKLRRVDWFGSVLFIGSATSLIIPLTWGGVMYDWDSWHTTVPLLTGAFGLIIFTMYEEKFTSQPLIHTTVFKNRTAAIAYAQTFLHGIILWCILYYLPLYFEGVQEYSTTLSGLSLFPQCFTIAPAAIFTGVMVDKTGRYRWAVWIGWTLATAGVPLLILFDVNTATYQWILLGIVSGMGLGLLFPAVALSLQAASSPGEQAYAMTMFSFVRTFGETVGVAVGGVIFQNRVHDKLLDYPAFAAHAADLAKDATGIVKIINDMPDGENKQNLQNAFVYGLQSVWLVMTGLAGISLLLSLFIEGLPLNQALVTDQRYMREDDEKRLIGTELDEFCSRSRFDSKSDISFKGSFGAEVTFPSWSQNPQERSYTRQLAGHQDGLSSSWVRRRSSIYHI